MHCVFMPKHSKYQTTFNIPVHSITRAHGNQYTVTLPKIIIDRMIMVGQGLANNPELKPVIESFENSIYHEVEDDPLQVRWMFSGGITRHRDGPLSMVLRMDSRIYSDTQKDSPLAGESTRGLVIEDPNRMIKCNTCGSLIWRRNTEIGEGNDEISDKDIESFVCQECKEEAAELEPEFESSAAGRALKHMKDEVIPPGPPKKQYHDMSTEDRLALRQLKDKVRKAECEKCGKTVDENGYRQMGVYKKDKSGEFVEDNLVSLCSQCAYAKNKGGGR